MMCLESIEFLPVARKNSQVLKRALEVKSRSAKQLEEAVSSIGKRPCKDCTRIALGQLR